MLRQKYYSVASYIMNSKFSKALFLYDSMVLHFVNVRMKFKGRRSHYSRAEREPFFKVDDGEQSLIFCRRIRAPFYKNGIGRRLQILMTSYNLDKIPQDVTGAFIDCGANIGELGLVSRARGWQYHAFEPEQLEADCCDINAFQGQPKCNRLALWSEETTLTFYSKPDTADSSVFEQTDIVSKKEIKTTTIDKYISDAAITDIAVLKIEAEGAEPEVLLGAEAALTRAKFVTVDCGFERGMAQESTLVPVANFLLKRNYELVAWDRNWYRFLFMKV